MKTEIFNLIVLDESGSMGIVRPQTISGCNETIDTIKAAQEQFGETQDHYLSIYAFHSGCGMPSHYLVKNLPAVKAHHITTADYTPNGGTPLYDAIGSTLADLKATVKSRKLAIGSVTIITDGEENSSSRYSLAQVSKMIDELKEMGWNINFIGANINVSYYATQLNIDNAMEFTQDEEGVKAMFKRERASRMAYNERLDCFAANANTDDEEVLMDGFRKASKDYFKE